MRSLARALISAAPHELHTAEAMTQKSTETPSPAYTPDMADLSAHTPMMQQYPKK